ncbi:MAG: CAP domain-containing protein [Minisyncoccota bacterium]
MNIRLKIPALLLFFGCVATMPALTHAAVQKYPLNQFKETLTTLTNNSRVALGDSPVTVNLAPSRAAQKKANDMATKGYFAHYSPSGISPWYWITAAGYYYTHAGENLAINFDSPTAVEAAWMASPAHRANIVRGIYRQTGIGIAHGTYLGRPATFIVQLFATPAVYLAKMNKLTPMAVKTF